MIPTRRQWKGWSLPSKLTAIGTLVGLISLGLYLAEKSYDFLGTQTHSINTENFQIPPVVLAIENSTDETYAIQCRGDFVLWLPQGVDYARRLPGKYDLDVQGGQLAVSVIRIDPHMTVNVVAKLHAEFSLRRMLDRGVADIEFIFKNEQGGLLFSGSIPFTRQSIKTTRWKIDIARKE